MNQILVTKKLYITPELKRKKKIYKVYLIISVFLICILTSIYIYAEYDRNKSEQVSQEILSELESEDNTIANSNVLVVALSSDYVDDTEIDVSPNNKETSTDNNKYTESGEFTIKTGLEDGSQSDTNDFDTLINNLKPIELDSFKEGYITEISGYIPMFKMDYELNLINDLKTLGITSVFDESAQLSNITSDKAYITDASHSANIEFSNDGIKAAAATIVGGAGDVTDPNFDYFFEIPIEKIDLTFDKPFMYLIRDKETGEIWFAGTVYEPIDMAEYEEEYEQYSEQYFNELGW